MNSETIQIIKKYLDQLIDQSNPKEPAWNIEHIRGGGENKWNYVDGCMMKATLEMYYITGKENYLEFVDDYIRYFVTEEGKILTYNIDEYNIDHINEGKVLFDLYKLKGDERFRKGIDTLYEQIKTHPRTDDGNFWHKKVYPHQVWLDGLYMAQPFYMAYETQFNNKSGYEDIMNQFKEVVDHMKDPVTGLYYHGYDTSKSMFWCDKETGLSKNFWGRAMGWFVMAVIDVIEVMSEDNVEEREYLEKVFVDAIDALIKVQSPSGMWYQLLNLPEVEGNYLETSASAIIAYAILKGVRLGVLDQSYRTSGEKAFEDMCDRHLVEEEDRLSLGGICLVAGLGGKGERRDGSVAYYLSEPVVKDEAKGLAPFLLCFTELLRLQ